MTTVKFTADSLAAVPPPLAGHRLYIRDSKTPGLILDITPRGARTFYVYRRVAGRPQRIRIGELGAYSVERARRRAAEIMIEIAAGKNPMADKRDARHAAERQRDRTLGAMFADYLDKHAKLHKRASSVAEDERLWARYFTPWAARPADSITRADVEQLHRRIGTRTFNGKHGGPFAANRMLALLSAMYRKRGEAFGLPAGFTPTAGVRRFREPPRDRVLDLDELQRFLAAVDALDSQTMRDFLRMLLYTGARRANVMSMRWDDIRGLGDNPKQLGPAEWRIPAELAKAGKPLRIPLVAEAVEILRGRAHTSPYVFPARGSTTRPMQSPGKAMRQVCQAAGIAERTTLHDLRRTWITAQVRAGVNMAVVSAAAGHQTMATTLKHYAVAGDKAVRDSVTAGVASMLKSKSGSAA